MHVYMHSILLIKINENESSTIKVTLSWNYKYPTAHFILALVSSFILKSWPFTDLNYFKYYNFKFTFSLLLSQRQNPSVGFFVHLVIVLVFFKKVFFCFLEVMGSFMSILNDL